MYKRRKKITPSASSTLINGTSKSGSFVSSQSSMMSTISSQARSDSPDDMFSSPQKTLDGPSTSADSPAGKSSQPKKTTTDLMMQLLSSDDSEPLPKIAKTNGCEPNKMVLSQVTATGPSKYFYEVLSNSGMVISKGGEPNLLRKPQFEFVPNLRRALQKSSSEVQNVERFIENLEEYLSDADRLKSALLPTKNHPDANLPGDCTESMIHMLLSIDSIQAKLISFLLDKVAEFSVDADESGSKEPLVIVRMILQSMRYLTKLSDPEAFTLKLFDLIHSISSSMLKDEVISFLPDIISDAQREQTATELMELMKCEPHLSPSILYTLSNLWLDPESLFQVQRNLLRMLPKATADQLPAFLHFITSTDFTQHGDEIINGLRSELVIIHADSSSTQTKKLSQSDLSSTIFLTFAKLRDSVLKSKKLSDLWLKNIEKVKTASYHKPIDILMLLILHSLTPDGLRKRAVETVFKNKIKIGHFKESLIQDTFSVGLVVVKEHFSGLLKLLSALLLSPDITVSRFAKAFYTELFLRVGSMSRKMIIQELNDNINMSKGNAKPALGLLHSLVNQYPEKVTPFFTLIMTRLDTVNEMRVCEVRQLIDLLCLMAFSDSDSSFHSSATQDELYMIVQKQLACPDPKVFRCGIVSGVVIVSHMVKIMEAQSNETPSSELEEIVLKPMSVKALNLFELVLSSTRNYAEAQVLLFDQFSYMIKNSDNMDKFFMKKISLLLQCQLQNYYIIQSSEYLVKENCLEPMLQFCIDTDFTDPIVFNLVDALFIEVNSSNTLQRPIPLIALPGLVRVIRHLESSDLSEIDALLGCAISFPSPKIYTNFSSLEPYTQRLALDCLFHVSNWMREMLNSFLYVIKELSSAEKLLQRLRAVVYFQNLISLCLPQAISYTPPKCYFEAGEGKQITRIDKIRAPTRKKSKKGNKNEEKGDDESVDETAVESDEEKDDELISLESSKFKQHLRELDFDVCLMCTQTLTLVPEPFKGSECSGELGPSELLFLLEDLDAKLKFCLGPRKFGKSKPSVGFDFLTTCSIDLIITNTYKLAPYFAAHLQKIVEYLHKLIAESDGIMDAPGIFCPGSHEIKQCLALLFSIFNTFFSWPDLESEAYFKYLIRFLIKLSGSNVDKRAVTSKNDAVKGALLYLKSLGTCVLDLASAVGLVNLIKTIDFLQDDEDKNEFNIGELCGELLERKWYDGKGVMEKGTKVNQQLTVLLDIYLSEPEHISTTLTWLPQEVDSLTSTDASLTTFPHFNKSNLNVLIRSLCKGLLVGLKSRLEKQDPKVQLKIWDSVLNNLQSLIGIIKIHDSRINLRQFLKGCLPIMRYFLSHGMSVCSTMFKFESLEVSQTMKKLQVVTRYIQSICNYSKVNKDNVLIHQLPSMRGTLEKLLLSVKNMVLQNKCTDAFFMGSMRHKDIHGEIITAEEGEEEERNTEEEIVAAADVAEESSGNESDAQDEGNSGSLSDTC